MYDASKNATTATDTAVLADFRRWFEQEVRRAGPNRYWVVMPDEQGEYRVYTADDAETAAAILHGNSPKRPTERRRGIGGPTDRSGIGTLMPARRRCGGAPGGGPALSLRSGMAVDVASRPGPWRAAVPAHRGRRGCSAT